MNRSFLKKYYDQWPFLPRIVSWLNDSCYRSQLPFLYRCFAHFCIIQISLWKHLIGGKTFFNLIKKFTTKFNLSDHTRIEIGDYKVYLNLLDPRMLVVPNELIKKETDTKLLNKYLSHGDTFIDVGANHGGFSLVASRILGVNGMIVAIEPNPILADLLKKSLKDTSLCKFNVFNFACGNYNGHVDFFIPHFSTGSASIFHKYTEKLARQVLTIPIKLFDDAIDWMTLPGRLFLKLDIEGSELGFLQDAASMIRKRKPKILIEINPTAMKAAGVTCEKLRDILKDLGYKKFMEARPGGNPPAFINLI